MTLKLTFAGFNYVADVDGSYATADSLLSMISSTASNSVALTDDYGIDPSTNTIYADYSSGGTTGNTETIANLTATIKEAETDGLTVMVRPLVDFTVDASAAMLKSPDGTQYYNPEWRASYNPTDTTTFFNSYDTMIVAQATAAQAGGAQLFDIGTELDQLTGSAYLTQWTKIINDVKAVFHGQLTYSAISDDDLSPWRNSNFGTGLSAGTGDITTQVSFWSQLDYIGIDEYAAISDANNGGANPDPTLAQLIAGWENAPTDPTTSAMTGGLSLIQYYENVSTTLGKPLLFTELGYNSAPDAASQPFYTSSSTYDPTLQANLYQAFITAWKADGNTSLQGVYIWNWEPDPSTVGAGTNPSWTPQGDTGSLQVVDAGYTAATACFAAGTRIATPDADVPVEALRAGQLVRTAAGEAKPVSWIGHRRVDCRRHPRPEEVWPVRVQAHAFGPGRPHRDLWLSPDHAVLVRGDGKGAAPDVLIPIRYLVNGASVRQRRRDQVTYYHVELAAHEVLLAEGLPAESYLDTGNRAAFANGGTTVMATPDFARRVWASAACAPLVMDGPRLIRVRQALLRHAEHLGHVQTADAGLRLIADGPPLAPVCRGSTWCVDLPATARQLTIVSRRFVPAHMEPASDDYRVLGVAVSRLALDRHMLAPADERLGAGWHAPEPDWRWTDGAAELAVAGARTLAFDVVMTRRYWQETPAADTAAAPQWRHERQSLI